MPAFDRASLDSSPEDPSKDLGFGSEVARGSHKRLLNRDGSFNVVRFGLTPFSSLSIYHWSLSTSWPRFLGMLAVAYPVSYTHLRAHETDSYLVCRLLLEKKKKKITFSQKK